MKRLHIIVLDAAEVYEVAITGSDCLCALAASGTPVINVQQINFLAL